MLRDIYKKIRSYLHVADNTMKDNPGNIGNKLYKIATVTDHVKQNCNKTEPEQYQSMDEQIVPAKTLFSGIRHYNPKKQQNGASKMLFILASVVLSMISSSQLEQLQIKSAMVLML